MEERRVGRKKKTCCPGADMKSGANSTAFLGVFYVLRKDTASRATETI